MRWGTATVAPAKVRLPRRFWAWIAGSTTSLLGTQMLFFALAWVAAGHGGAAAGLVLTAGNLPRTALLLMGGALADRVGLWRVLVVGDVVMTVATGLLALAVVTLGTPLWLLIGAAFLTGVVDAFYEPAAAALPRQLVPLTALGRGVPAGQVAVQLANSAGPPLGGLAVALGGLAAAAAFDAVSFLVVLGVLLRLRAGQAMRRSDQGAAHGGRAWLRECLEGLRVVAAEPLLRVGLLLLCVVAAMLLPVFGLLVPVLGQQRGWPAAATGGIAGAISAGMAAAALLVVIRGPRSRPGVAAAGGLAVAGGGLLVVALSPDPWPAMGAGAAAGVGLGAFTAHLAPLVIGYTPDGRVARVQSVVMLAQSTPLLLSNVVLGAAAELSGAAPVLTVVAVATLACAAAASSSPTLRSAQWTPRAPS